MMSKSTRTVSNFLLISCDVVGSNVLDQSLEGLEKISSAGCDVRTAMVMVISSSLFFRNFCVCDAWTMAIVSKANPGFERNQARDVHIMHHHHG
jgi:hypothetical protein